MTKLSDIAQAGVDVAQDMSNKAWNLTQNLVPPTQRKPQKNGKLARKPLDRWQASLRDTVGSGVSTAQGVLQSGIDYTQAAFIKDPRRASKRVQKAQKNLQKVQSTIQQQVGTGLASTQKVFKQGRQQAQQAAMNARGMRDDWMRRRVQARLRAVRARRLFRLGIVAGVVLALLYAPTAGSEVRRRIVEWFQQGRAMLGY